MPRPSLKEQRTKEILDAYLTCVAKYGLAGATQERIATEAGVKRPLLRHYLGNGDNMLVALLDHVVAEYDAIIAAIETAMHEAPPQSLIDLLFDQNSGTDPASCSPIKLWFPQLLNNQG